MACVVCADAGRADGGGGALYEGLSGPALQAAALSLVESERRQPEHPLRWDTSTAGEDQRTCVCVCVCVCGYIQWNLCISDNLVLSIIIIIEKCPLFEGVLYSSIGKCIFGAPNLVRPLFGVSFSGSSTVAI